MHVVVERTIGWHLALLHPVRVSGRDASASSSRTTDSGSYLDATPDLKALSAPA